MIGTLFVTRLLLTKMNISILLPCVLLLVHSLHASQFRCDYVNNGAIGGHLKFHEVPADFYQARLICRTEGAKLASPLNDKLLNAMIQNINQTSLSCGVLTGIHATFSKGNYLSSEGIPLSQIPHSWAENEPDNYHGEENCLILTSNGQLADVNCSEPFPFFCFMKSERVTSFNADCGTIDQGYKLDSRTKSCYKFHRTPAAWPRAQTTCAGEGGHLAIINSPAEAQVFRTLFDNNPASSMNGVFPKDIALIGFRQWEDDGEWYTLNGETIQEAGYAQWHTNQPDNNLKKEHCGSIRRLNLLLNDLECDRPYPFVCEKKPDSLLCEH